MISRAEHGAVRTPDGVLLVGGVYSPTTTEIVVGKNKGKENSLEQGYRL